MKLDNGGSRNQGQIRLGGKQGSSGARMTPLPVEWMDPMSWRLPSGKALAEFALQSGFLAPLVLGVSMGDGRIRRKTSKSAMKKSAEGVPVSTGTFRGAVAERTGFGSGRFGSGERG